jgi:hypothetical protein
MKTPEDSARLYISEEYHERLLKEIGPADSLVERVFLDGVKFGYEWAKQRHAKQLTQAYPCIDIDSSVCKSIKGEEK